MKIRKHCSHGGTELFTVVKSNDGDWLLDSVYSGLCDLTGCELKNWPNVDVAQDVPPKILGRILSLMNQEHSWACVAEW